MRFRDRPFAVVLATLIAAQAVLAAALGALYLFHRFLPQPFAAVEQALISRWLNPDFLGDGQPASQLLLCYPMGLALDGNGDLLISDRGRARRGRVVWRIDAAGIAHIAAGSGLRGKGTERRALDLRLERPESMAVAPDGSLFLSDGYLDVVYRIRRDGSVERFAGTGERGDAGDGGKATEARFHRPADLRLDANGNLFVADVRNHRVRRIDPAGTITTVAGTGVPGFSPDGTLAVEAKLDTPWGIGLDREDHLLIGDAHNHRVRRVGDDGRLVTIAGTGRPGFDGDGGPATEASLNSPEGLAMDREGRLYIGDEWNNAVRRVDANGIISTVIGTGYPGRAWVGGVARVSPVDDPELVLATERGVVIADGNNGRVIRVGPSGIVELVAGREETAPCAPIR
jgi:sugar lactone lactonase YvrE